MTVPAAPEIATLREAWDARCHFCNGPSFPWLTDDETWAKVEPLLGQHQACFECFGAARRILGHNTGEPFHVSLDSLEARLRAAETELQQARQILRAASGWIRYGFGAGSAMVEEMDALLAPPDPPEQGERG